MTFNLSDAFGTARFGRQSLQQGTDLASALATGFVRRMNREDEEEKRQEAEQKALLGGIASLAGAAIGSQIPGVNNTLGATIGSEVGKSLLGKAQPENIINVALKQQELQQKEDLASKKLFQAQKKQAIDELEAMSKADLVKEGLEEVSADTPGAMETYLVDDAGYRKGFVKKKGTGAKFSEEQTKTITEVESILMKDDFVTDNRNLHNELIDLKAALEKKDPSLVGALQSRIARALAGEKGVLTDRDIIRVAGSQALWDKGLRLFKKVTTGKPLDKDIKAFSKYIKDLQKNLVENNNEYVESVLKRRTKTSDVTMDQFNEVFGNDFYLDRVKEPEDAEFNVVSKDQVTRLQQIAENKPNTEEGKKAIEILKRMGLIEEEEEPMTPNPLGMTPVQPTFGAMEEQVPGRNLLRR